MSNQIKKKIKKNNTLDINNNFDKKFWNDKIVENFIILCSFVIKKMKLKGILKLECSDLEAAPFNSICAVLKSGEHISLDFYQYVNNNDTPSLQELLMEIDDVLLHCDLDYIKEKIESKTEEELSKGYADKKYTKEELFIKQAKLAYFLKHGKKIETKKHKIENSSCLNNKIAKILFKFGNFAIQELNLENICYIYCDLENPKFLYAIDIKNKKIYLDFYKNDFLQSSPYFEKLKKIVVYFEFCNKKYIQEIVQKKSTKYFSNKK